MTRVIQIDDEELILKYFSRVCSIAGHQYQGYLSIDDAIDAGVNPDVILLDRTGHGMSPEALLAKTRSQWQNARVIGVSGDANLSREQKAQYDAYLRKPVSSEEILTAIADNSVTVYGSPSPTSLNSEQTSL